MLPIIFLAVAALLMAVEWLLIVAKRDSLRLDLLAWACVFVAAAIQLSGKA